MTTPIELPGSIVFSALPVTRGEDGSLLRAPIPVKHKGGHGVLFLEEHSIADLVGYLLTQADRSEIDWHLDEQGGRSCPPQ